MEVLLAQRADYDIPFCREQSKPYADSRPEGRVPPVSQQGDISTNSDLSGRHILYTGRKTTSQHPAGSTPMTVSTPSLTVNFTSTVPNPMP